MQGMQMKNVSSEAGHLYLAQKTLRGLFKYPVLRIGFPIF